MNRILIILLLSLSAISAYAKVAVVRNTDQTMVVEASASHVMSENETQANAVQIAVEKAKFEAIERSGSYHL